MTNKQSESLRPKKWGDKPYRSLDFHLREQFGEKIYKLSLDGGMTCPNRDGTLGSNGCIFCSMGGSGDFAGDRALTITQQIEAQKLALQDKKGAQKYIAYFQAYTNTYAPVLHLEKIFSEAMSHPDIVALSIGTRPDCLPSDVLALLDRLNRIKPVWVELGLQTIYKNSAKFIRRGYELPCFEEAVHILRLLNIDVIVHMILGLPGESVSDLTAAMDYLNSRDIQGIKLHLLHVLADTELATVYESGNYTCMTQEEYIHLLIACLEHLSPDITIHRMTGDGPKDLLIAPLWSSNKRNVLNTIHKELKIRDTWQGRGI